MTNRINSMQDYRSACDMALKEPAQYWAKIAENFQWVTKWDSVLSSKEFTDVKWFDGATLNITHNCLDRHAQASPNKVAIYFEANQMGSSSSRAITYIQLLREVSRLSNTLRSMGIKKGDRVTLYMSMTPDLLMATLACARIGAIHSVVFGGFSAISLAERISDAKSNLVLTQPQGHRGEKIIPLQQTVIEALKILEQRGESLPRVVSTDDLPAWWKEKNITLEMPAPAEIMEAEDPLFILYTSGSTGKPKGLLHTTAGYMVWAAETFKQVFGVDQLQDVFWCTADIGWITGHSYVCYGPLLEGVTQVIFEGIPTHPTPARFWQVIDKYQVTHFYTAPTAIRSLEACGTAWFENCDLKSLKVLGSVGEPINVEAWEWYHRNVGKGKCPIVDTWWQTETGGIMISPLANITNCIPSYAMHPLPGVSVALLNEEGLIISSNAANGNLVITRPWPGMARTIWNDDQRYQQTYFSTYPGYYFTGDGARRDEEGHYRITGRVDDVLNVSGHRLSTAEIENAINAHPSIVESAVVGVPHEIKGQGIFAYILLDRNYSSVGDVELLKEINVFISKMIGPLAKLDQMLVLTQLPKTRSGKIMRRILRKSVERDWSSLGDTSTLLNPEIIDEIKLKLSKLC